MVKELLEHFMRKKRQLKQFRFEKVIKKRDELYLKSKGYDDSFDN